MNTSKANILKANIWKENSSKALSYRLRLLLSLIVLFGWALQVSGQVSGQAAETSDANGSTAGGNTSQESEQNQSPERKLERELLTATSEGPFYRIEVVIFTRKASQDADSGESWALADDFLQPKNAINLTDPESIASDQEWQLLNRKIENQLTKLEQSDVLGFADSNTMLQQNIAMLKEIHRKQIEDIEAYQNLAADKQPADNRADHWYTINNRTASSTVIQSVTHWQKEPVTVQMDATSLAAQLSFDDQQKEQEQERERQLVWTPPTGFTSNDWTDIHIEIENELTEDAPLVGLPDVQAPIQLFTPTNFDKTWGLYEAILRIIRIDNLDIVGLGSWAQPVTDRPVTPSVHFQSKPLDNRGEMVQSAVENWLSTADESLKPPAVHGYVTMWKRRFVHVHLNLLYRQYLEGVEQYQDIGLEQLNIGAVGDAHSDAWLVDSIATATPATSWQNIKFWIEYQNANAVPESELQSGFSAFLALGQEVQTETGNDNDDNDDVNDSPTAIATPPVEPQETAESDRELDAESKQHWQSSDVYNDEQVLEQYLESAEYRQRLGAIIDIVDPVEKIPPYLISTSYAIDESRKIDLDNVYYFDHPKFGALVLVTKVEPEGE